MKKSATVLMTALVATTMFLVTSCGNNPGSDDKPTITVSILPQEYFVSQIAGDLFSINIMIPPGASPATYEPTPAQLTRLSKTDLYLKMGYTGFEMAWMDKLSSSNKQMKIVNLSEGVNLITEATMQGERTEHRAMEEHSAEEENDRMEEHAATEEHEAIKEHGALEEHSAEEGNDTMEGHGTAAEHETIEGHGAMEEHGTTTEHEDIEGHDASDPHHSMDVHQASERQSEMEAHGHHHGGIDPHTWLSPKNVKIIAQNIHDALAATYPEHKEIFATNLSAFLGKLDSLDRSITLELQDLSSRSFFTYHPSLSYFARDYNLVQHPLELGGKTPSAAHMKQLIDKGREEQIGVVFLQMQFDQKNAEVLAKEISAEIVQINPLDPEWFTQMLFITGKLKENLR